MYYYPGFSGLCHKQPDIIRKKDKKMGKFSITSYVWQKGEKAGYINLYMNSKANYQIDLHLFGISVPVESYITDNYSVALQKMQILENRYSY